MKKRKKEAIIIIILSIIFVILTYLIFNNKLITLDNITHSYIISIRNEKLTSIFKLITNLGSATCLIIINIFLFLLSKNKNTPKYLAIHLTIGILLNQLIKIIFTRPRPLNINIINISGYSYPSGHSMMSLILYGYLIYLIHKSKLNQKLKLIIIIFLIIMILLIGFSRIYLGVHYLTDVIGGFILASIYLLVAKNIKLEKK